MSPNILRIILGWDGLGFSSFCLIIFYQNRRSKNSRLITIFRNRIGDSIFILLISIIIYTNNFSIFNILLNDSFIIIIFFIGSITKRAQFPISVWLPAAIAAPTPVSSLVHSSTLVTAGLYLIIRFHKVIELWKDILVPISLLTILIAGTFALNERDSKKIIALSTLSQLGLIIFSLIIGAWKLSFFHLIIHAIFKSIIFISCGIEINFNYGNQNSNLFCKHNSNFSTLFFYLRNINLIRIPFTSGFYSKDSILDKRQIILNNFIIISFVIRCILTYIYSIRIIMIVLNKSKYSNPIVETESNYLFNMSPLIIFLLTIILGITMFYSTFLTNQVFIISEKFYDIILLISIIIYLFIKLKTNNISILSWLSTKMLNINPKYIFIYFDLLWLEKIGPQNIYFTITKLTNLFTMFRIIQIPLTITFLIIYS